jgi:hypothetical protein
MKKEIERESSLSARTDRDESQIVMLGWNRDSVPSDCPAYLQAT